jgi:hypothetical protein
MRKKTWFSTGKFAFTGFFVVATTIVLFMIIASFMILSLSSFVSAAPAGPTISYVSNSTKAASSSNRSIDEKGTITVLTVSLNQQDYKWKAYVGNISGALVLDDANSKSIYDWSLSSVTGEIYATRQSATVSWGIIDCANQSVIDDEQAALGMSSSMRDSINSTFNNTVHKSFLVGTLNITTSSCRATATYINDSAQAVSEAAHFQEVLLKDNSTNALIYASLLSNDHQSYNDIDFFDFQMILAENESSSVPINYYFYAELG